MPSLASPSGLLPIVRSNWQSEVDDQAIYEALAERELDAKRRNAFRGIAAAEKHHSELWAKQNSVLGGGPLIFQHLSNNVGTNGRSEAGINAELHVLKDNERKSIELYEKQISLFADKASFAILREIISDENEHYRIISRLITSRPQLPVLVSHEAKIALENLLAARRKNYPEAASWLNEALYSANDGLGSIFGIVSGVSGATMGCSHFVLIAGIAGMTASAISTGISCYVSAETEREILQAGIVRERRAVELDEAEAREVLALSYQIRGLPQDVADRIVNRLAENKEQFVRALARARVNNTEESLVGPWSSAITGAVSPTAGAFVPVLPFLFWNGIHAIIVAAAISLAAHFILGVAKARMTVRSWWSAGFELAAFGAVEGGVTYAIGISLGRIGGAR